VFFFIPKKCAYSAIEHCFRKMQLGGVWRVGWDLHPPHAGPKVKARNPSGEGRAQS
jgi:hypothetical protein